MRCAPAGAACLDGVADVEIALYGPGEPGQCSAGGKIAKTIRRCGLVPSARAWDFLSIALSVVAADFAVVRDRSPDGWTRELELDIAVTDPVFWSTQSAPLTRALAFLTTDRWALRFRAGGQPPPPVAARKRVRPAERSVMLLSGGLDSLVGAIDLATTQPFSVSQTVTGDGVKQETFAKAMGLSHLALNHTCVAPGVREKSQRARSMIFIAYGVLIASALRAWEDGERVTLYICENGYIALNPPLTGGRLGSLSTRTAHPGFLGILQRVFDAAAMQVDLLNPYATTTKGEMMAGCADQSRLMTHAVDSTSCGRFGHYGYRHCGRCVPCQVRRAAFLAWGQPDTIAYVYEDLGQPDEQHAGFDDVRAVGEAIVSLGGGKLERWFGATLATVDGASRGGLEEVARRGLEELAALHARYDVT